ncbi:energy transducer TonB [Pseudomonas sp. B26(2017)]|uniref:energy transducer TonB n=1 Tax=Pseudomonas sp. B26(2017) TaxID=1981732 RepID=UPI000A1FC855|nr:energy transducer TonB [Pseudomonas sp. B26(2017)]
MRWWMLLVLLLVAGSTWAAEVFLIPEHHPKPIYPPGLQRAGFTGGVKVSFTVSADGAVSKVGILKSDHAELSDAVKKALAQWRFKPWTVEGERPPEQEIIAPMTFGFDSPDGVNLWLKDLKCREFNSLLAHYPRHAWVDAAPFHYVRGYLANTFFQGQIPMEQRLAMVAKMNKRVPSIVTRCQKSPGLKYVTLLPEDIRKVL